MCIPIKLRVGSLVSLLLGIMVTAVNAQAQNPNLPESCYLLSSFRNNGEDGLHLAWSTNGLNWVALKSDKSFLRPQVGKEKLMRDPCVTQGPDGTFHMVWTDSWTDRTIGYAHSKDLINWSEQTAIPVMAHEPTARNCWAPEIIYDKVRKRFLIFWSTTIPGRFPKTDSTAESGYNHRIYATTTEDFKSFTATRLFFDPGFNVIDATIITWNGNYFLIFKNETRDPVAQKNLYLASGGTDVEGPYAVISTPINPPGSWTEGPSAIQVGSDLILYFDCYAAHHYGALRTRDLEHWKDVTTELAIPKATRHGTVFKVSRDVLSTLLAVGGDRN